jgi:serine/threonine protein kinase
MLNFKQEWETLNVASKTHSPEIIKGYSALRTDKGKLVMVMEYAPHGSLDAFAEILRDAKERGLSDVQIIRIKAMLLGDIFRGIASTHRANVIHGDLKPHISSSAKAVSPRSPISERRSLDSISRPRNRHRWIIRDGSDLKS